MKRRNDHLVVGKGKNCADASNGPAPHSRRLVSTAPFRILTVTATQSDTVVTSTSYYVPNAAAKTSITLRLY